MPEPTATQPTATQPTAAQPTAAQPTAALPLADLQRWLRWAIAEAPRASGVSSRAAATALAPPIAPEPTPCAAALIIGARGEARGITRERRLRAYSDAFQVRLTETLALDFKGLRAVLGDEALGELATGYFSARPARVPNLADFGRQLPAFLREHPAGVNEPFLVDLAELEWRIAEAYFADDLPALDVASLASVAPEAWASARFELDPSVSWLELAWPVLRLRRLAETDRDVAPAIPRRRRAERVLVFRDLPGDVQVRRASAAELRTLEALRAGNTLGEVTAAETAPPTLFQTWFQNWVSDGLIRKLVLE